MPVELEENVLADLGLDRGGCTPESVKGNAEPTINIIVYLIVTVAQFTGAYSLLGRPGFRCGTIFIGSANIEGFVTP